MILREKSFHLHLQHPKQRLSMPTLCSKPKQLRERLEKDRAGRSTISFKRSRLSSERTTAICKRNLGNQSDWPYRPRPQGGITYVAPILSAGCLKALVLSKKRGIKKRRKGKSFSLGKKIFTAGTVGRRVFERSDPLPSPTACLNRRSTSPKLLSHPTDFPYFFASFSPPSDETTSSRPILKMAPKKTTTRAPQENISLGPSVRDGMRPLDEMRKQKSEKKNRKLTRMLL
jgi:hypothetical protein